MKYRRYDDKNVNYLHLSIVQLSWFRIMVSVIGMVFTLTYIILMASNEAMFTTRINRIGMMLWSAVGGMLVLGFIAAFIHSWITIREIQEQEIAERTQLFGRKNNPENKEK